MTHSVSALFRDGNGDSVSITDAYSSNTDVASVSMGASHVTITGVAPGTAMVYITGADPHGATGSHSISVTVMSADLGAPTSLTATAGDASVTLSWMAGNLATKHWIAGIAVNADGTYDYSKNVWTSAAGAVDDGTGMMTLDVTMTSDGEALVNGMPYKFTVAAGRGVGSSSEWSAWAPAQDVTPMAAGGGNGGGPTNPFGN